MFRSPSCPTAGMPHLQASRLACSLRRQGKMFARMMCVTAAEPQQMTQQQAASVAAGQQAAPPAAVAAASPLAQQQVQQQAQQLSVVASSSAATQLLAHFFACELRPADCYLLYGSVGAGKSYFSRAFIRTAADDEELPVPSPTFLLQNIYTDHQGPPIHHFDLYRLTQRYDFARLDLPTSFTQAVCLVEWAQRLAALAGSSSSSGGGAGGSDTSSSSSPGSSSSGSMLPADPLEVHISIVEAAEQGRLQQVLQQQRRQPQKQEDKQQQQQQREQQWQQPQDSEEVEEDDEDTTGSSDDDGSGDTRWRLIRLVAPGSSAGSSGSSSGSSRWQPRLQLLQRYLAAEGEHLGCFLLEAESEGEEHCRGQEAR